MLFFIAKLIIFISIIFAGIVLFYKFRDFQRRKEELEMKESEFLNRLLVEREQKTDQPFQMGDNRKNDLRAAIYEIINRISEDEMHELLKHLEREQFGERRQCERKDFLRIVDYQVGDHYYRDFIQNISETGLFIKPSQELSVGQTVSMTFMSPDNQKPFKMKGEIIHTDNDGVGIKFKIESQVQRLVLKSYIDMIQG
jgi:hypothetical protein